MRAQLQKIQSGSAELSRCFQTQTIAWLKKTFCWTYMDASPLSRPNEAVGGEIHPLRVIHKSTVNEVPI